MRMQRLALSGRCHGLMLLALSFAASASSQVVTPSEIEAGLALWSTQFTLSADAGWLAFQTTKGMAGMDVKSGRTTNLDRRWSAPVGSPVAPQLNLVVFLREGKNRLGMWTLGSQTPRELMVYPRDLYRKAALWSADGKTVFVVLDQHLPWPKSHPDDDNPPTVSANVELQLAGTYREQRARKRFEREYPEAYAEVSRSLILAVDVASGRVGLLAKGNDIDNVYPSPDGKRLIAVQIKNSRSWDGNDFPLEDPTWTKQRYGDLYALAMPDVADLPAIDLEALEDRKVGWSDHAGQRLRPILSDLHLSKTGADRFLTSLSWSPDGGRFAYAAMGKESTGDVFVYDFISRQLTNLTRQITLLDPHKSLGYAGERYIGDYRSDKFGEYSKTPLWMPDGQAIVAIGAGDVWKIPLDASQPASNLTRDFPLETLRVVPRAHTRGEVAVDAQGQITLLAKERLSRNGSIWSLQIAGGKTIKVADANAGIDEYSLRSDVNGRELFFVAQTPQSLMNIRRTALKPGAVQELVTRLKLELLEKSFPRSFVLQWQTAAGPGFGLLYVPDGASERQKAPMVVEGSPGELMSRVDVRMQAGARSYTESLAGLLQSGFAVLYMDVPMSDEGVYEEPMRQINEGVTAAVDTALATGMIDEARLGIMGSSYGGFMVNAVVSHTNRFKAAVSVSALSNNWVSDYLGGGMTGTNYHEKGQGRFVLPLWDAPQRYLENSPLVYWNKVRTPLLILHGEMDETVPVRHAYEGFRGLERLGQPAILARYRRAGHGMSFEMERRADDWFREHLLGDKPVSHIADQGSFFLGGKLPGDRAETGAR